MKKLVAATLFVASVAFGAELLYGTLSGTNTQTLIVGRGAKLALQCTTGVRYVPSFGAARTVTANDALVAQGDPYKIDIGPNADRLNVAHQDTTTTISCSVFSRDP
jgi:hypothetical protein